MIEYSNITEEQEAKDTINRLKLEHASKYCPLVRRMCTFGCVCYTEPAYDKLALDETYRIEMGGCNNKMFFGGI